MFNRFTYSKEYKKLELALLKQNILLRHEDVISYNLCKLSDNLVGRFNYSTGQIDICVNNVDSPQRFDTVVLKGLIQYYDFIANGRKGFNSEQQYCSLVRANVLSHACTGITRFKSCIKDNVRKDIELLKSAETSTFEDAFDSVYEICVKDKKPFDLLS